MDLRDRGWEREGEEGVTLLFTLDTLAIIMVLATHVLLLSLVVVHVVGLYGDVEIVLHVIWILGRDSKQRYPLVPYILPKSSRSILAVLLCRETLSKNTPEVRTPLY